MNVRFTFSKSVMSFLATALLCVFAVNANAQVCSANSTIALDANCKKQINVTDLVSGTTTGLVFTTFKLLEADEHAIPPGDPVVENVGMASVIVSTPGRYKYEVKNETTGATCWNEVIIEAKGKPTCEPAKDAEPNVALCGAMAATADPSGIDDLASELVSCFVDDIEPWYDVLELTDFESCIKMQEVYSHDAPPAKACGVTGDALTALANAMIAEANVTNGPTLPTVPAGWEVCEVNLRSWWGKDWNNNFSDTCGQFVVVIRPTEVNLDMQVTTDCSTKMTTGLDAPYVVDADNAKLNDIITCPSNSGKKTKLTNGEFCKYTATSDDDNTIKTCNDKPGCEGLDKTAKDWTIWDWCHNSLPATLTLWETYMGDADNKNTMTPPAGIKEFTQIISTEDRDAPSFAMTPKPTPTVWPLSIDCGVKIQFGSVSATDACQGPIVADYEVVISYPSEHASYGGGASETYTKAEAMAGIEVEDGAIWTLKASAWDCCGNYETETFTDKIDAPDTTDPICIADDELVVAVVNADYHDADGNLVHAVGTRIKASSVNEGSYDACGEVTVKVNAVDTNAVVVAGLTSEASGDYLEYIWTTTDWSAATMMACELVIWVELEVTDEAGNKTKCQSAVKLVDNTSIDASADCEVIEMLDCQDKIPTAEELKTKYEDSDEAPTVWGTCYESSLVVTPKSVDHCPEDMTFCMTAALSKSNGGMSKDDVIEYFELTWTVSKKEDAQPDHSTVGPQTFTKYVVVTSVTDEKFRFPQDAKVQCNPDGMETIPAAWTSIDSFFINSGCSEWQLADVTEKTFTGDSDACYKIIRNYEFINWCRWDENLIDDGAQIDKDPFDTDGNGKIDGDEMVMMTYDGSSYSYTGNLELIHNGYFNYTQVIKVEDSIDPTADIDPSEGCGALDENGLPTNLPTEVAKDETLCDDGWAAFTIKPADVCSGSASVTEWKVYYEEGTDDEADVTASFDIRVEDDSTYIYGGLLGTGTYSVHARVDDPCGNFIWATDDVTVMKADCKAPTPKIYELYTAIMPENCEFTLSLAWLEASAFDNCAVVAEAIEDITGVGVSGTMPTVDPTDPTDRVDQVTFTSSGVKAIAYWVRDAAGNTAYATVNVNLGDNSGLCAGAGSGADVGASVGAKITNEDDEMVDAVTVKVMGGISAEELYNSIVNGTHSFSVPLQSNVSVEPSKDLGHLNGIGTSDLVAIQRHILSIVEINSPYKLIAADVTGNNSVNGQDLLHLSRLLLGIYDELPDVDSWRFIDKNHVFADPKQPWGFPEAINYASLDGDVQADFIGVKVGDVTGNAQPLDLLGSDDVTNGDMQISVADAKIAAGSSYEIDFTAKSFSDFTGYQFTINLDGVTLDDIKLGSLPGQTEANFALNRLDQGIITTYWANADAVNLEDGAVLFTLVVSADDAVNVSDAVSVSSDVTAAEAYDNDLEKYGVQLFFNKSDVAFNLYQNTPNPFSGETIIGFDMPEAGAASLKIMDVSGRVLKAISGTYAKGYNQEIINKADLGAAGVVYYQIDTETHTATKKMVILD